MSTSTTLTVRLKPDVKKQLARLALSTKRTRSFLAAEAITDYVTREMEIVAGIERGRADVRARRVVPHEKAMDEIDALIDRVARGRK